MITAHEPVVGTKEEQLLILLRQKFQEQRAKKVTGTMSVEIEFYQGGISKNVIGLRTTEIITR